MYIGVMSAMSVNESIAELLSSSSRRRCSCRLKAVLFAAALSLAFALALRARYDAARSALAIVATTHTHTHMICAVIGASGSSQLLQRCLTVSIAVCCSRPSSLSAVPFL